MTTTAKKAPTPPAPRPQPRVRPLTEGQRRAKSLADYNAALAARTAHVTDAQREAVRALRGRRRRRFAFWNGHAHELAMTLSEVIAAKNFGEARPLAEALAAVCREGEREMDRLSRRGDALADSIGVDRGDLWSL